MAKRFCGNGLAWVKAATRFSSSARIVIADTATAATNAVNKPAASSRHQQSPEGQLDHRDRQREYRRRCHARPPVTDQGSLLIASPASFDCGRADALKHPPAPQEIQPWLWPHCRICGRPGRFIDPFPRIPQRR
jgi:hypothetical protein